MSAPAPARFLPVTGYVAWYVSAAEGDVVQLPVVALTAHPAPTDDTPDYMPVVLDRMGTPLCAGEESDLDEESQSLWLAQGMWFVAVSPAGAEPDSRLVSITREAIQMRRQANSARRASRQTAPAGR